MNQKQVKRIRKSLRNYEMKPTKYDRKSYDKMLTLVNIDGGVQEIPYTVYTATLTKDCFKSEVKFAKKLYKGH